MPLVLLFSVFFGNIRVFSDQGGHTSEAHSPRICSASNEVHTKVTTKFLDESTTRGTDVQHQHGIFLRRVYRFGQLFGLRERAVWSHARPGGGRCCRLKLRMPFEAKATSAYAPRRIATDAAQTLSLQGRSPEAHRMGARLASDDHRWSAYTAPAYSPRAGYSFSMTKSNAPTSSEKCGRLNGIVWTAPK